jgi:hypothetical protein
MFEAIPSVKDLVTVCPKLLGKLFCSVGKLSAFLIAYKDVVIYLIFGVLYRFG